MVSNMTWGIWWIFIQPLKSPKIPLQWAIFVQNIWGGLNYKNTEEHIFHDTEKWCKIWTKPDFVVSKMTWGIWLTFIRAPKSLTIGVAKGVAKFKRKLTFDIRNLVNFHASSWKSENVHFDWIHLSKAYKYYMKKYRRVMSHDTEEWCKVWRKTDSWFQKWHEEFGEF